ncbi:MAG: 50S ribosomal protein L4 [SAR116 cluster bacterium MED-G04]|jgi:large subunit ribosomal protein L4|nr:50S ribosomal protein L4 [SAR116 cluster bacterium]CAI8406533.1 MAG: 50S ribosomal protein L4 [SAR116 cluster bacterium MED-G04]HCD49809.1 50S ribosomal protein L4 [Alphaproteobacteria bacterium]HCV62334.1 50S ribosomal protein L4 [Alphaproteobacteria bacterium]|tara:strand:+ start:1269 stop:1886 length:618 start_codon:yes stop_codon:yes gene_type:complete
MKLAVKTLDNKAAGDISLADSVFAIEPRADIMARVVNWQLAKRRAGTHKVQIRSEVNRTGAKLFRQKGTGNARHGAASSNIFRGGGVAHGPVVRDHAHSLQKKVRALGLRSALSVKARDGKLIVLDGLKADGKTASLKTKLGKLGLENALIIGGAELDDHFQRAASNIPNIDVLPQQGINVYDILRRDVLVLTKDSAAHLEERLK